MIITHQPHDAQQRSCGSNFNLQNTKIRQLKYIVIVLNDYISKVLLSNCLSNKYLMRLLYNCGKNSSFKISHSISRLFQSRDYLEFPITDFNNIQTHFHINFNMYIHSSLYAYIFLPPFCLYYTHIYLYT